MAMGGVGTAGPAAGSSVGVGTAGHCTACVGGGRVAHRQGLIWDHVAVDVAEIDVGDEPKVERRRPPVIVIVVVMAVVALGAGLLVRSSSDGGGEVEIESAEPELAGVAAATRSDSSARVAMRSWSDSEGEPQVLSGVMTFGQGGRGTFETEPHPGDLLPLSEIRALPDATYLFAADQWVRFSNEDFTLDNGIRFPEGQNALLGTIELLIDLIDHADPSAVRAVGTDSSMGDDVTVVVAEVDVLEAFRAGAEVVDEIAAGGVFDDVTPEIVVWLDEAGRARLVRLEADLETIEIELWDFGVDVDVEAPDDAVDQSTYFDDLADLDADAELERETEPDPNASEVDRFCDAFERRRRTAMITEPRDRSEDWAEAASDLNTLSSVAPGPAVDPLDRLVGVYHAIAVALDDGATITELIEDGVETAEGLMSWEDLIEVEVLAFAAPDILCTYR